jgi:hypothetical protein
MAKADQTEKTIRQIMKMVKGFSLDDLLDLRFDLEEKIEELKSEGKSTGSAAVESEPTITVREEYKRCGKPGCRCNTEGELHGPYIYEYWKEDGRTRSRYVGKAEGKKRKKRK